MQPFIDIAVRPAYGKHLAVVTWNVQHRFLDGDFFVWRSVNGHKGWELLNEEPVHGTVFSDLKAHDNAFYRILLEHRGESYDSPIIGLYDKLTRDEYRAVRKMMNIEYETMVTGRQGIRMLLYTPLTSGVLAPGVDPHTKQRFSTGLPEDPELDSYGELYVGGFAAPLVTYVKLSQVSPYTHSDAEDKSATTTDQDFAARFLAFPIPSRGDLLIHPETDKRYAVGETTQGYYFRGVIPTAFDVKLSCLYLSDPRYRVPVPVLEPEPRSV